MTKLTKILGIMMITMTLGLSNTHADSCSCWCLMTTGFGDSDCFPGGLQDGNENCNAKCKAMNPNNYEDGDSWCGPTAEQTCQSLASPGKLPRK